MFGTIGCGARAAATPLSRLRPPSSTGKAAPGMKCGEAALCWRGQVVGARSTSPELTMATGIRV